MTSFNGPITQRWLAFVHVVDRSGTVTALTGVFSERGVSFGSLSTLDVYEGQGTMSVEFRASARLAHVLMRTIDRLAVVRSAVLVHADDASLRALAAVTCPTADPTSCALDEPGVTLWTEGTGEDAATVLTGPLTSVERAVATLRQTGPASVVLTVLPPRLH